MTVLALAGFALMCGGLAMYHRATILVFDRWQTLRPREWAAEIRPTRRAFPFNVFVRSEVRRAKISLWHWSTPEWARGDKVAERWFRQLRTGPFVAAGGAFLLALSIFAN